jgi:hypothetical protein
MRKELTPKVETYEIDVLDADRNVVKRVTVSAFDRAWRMTIDGAQYEHVSDAQDGAWQFAPMK